MTLTWIARSSLTTSTAHSFTQIRAQDIRDQVDAVYASRRFFSKLLITNNPHYERGASVEALPLDLHQIQIWC